MEQIFKYLKAFSLVLSSLLITVLDVLAWCSLSYEVDSVNKMQWIFAKCF